MPSQIGRQRVGAAMPMLDPVKVDALVADLIASSRIGDEARAISTETPSTIAAAEVLIAASLTRQGIPADAHTVARIRRAMALPVADRMKPLPGATELLAEIRALGLRTVIASNTYWRDADSYWEDFRLLGMAEYIDAIVTSVDAGHLKPHPAVFEMAMRVVATPPNHRLMRHRSRREASASTGGQASESRISAWLIRCMVCWLAWKRTQALRLKRSQTSASSSSSNCLLYRSQ